MAWTEVWLAWTCYRKVRGIDNIEHYQPFLQAGVEKMKENENRVSKEGECASKRHYQS